MGGVLEPLIRDLEVTCLPLVIPDAIEVDVSALEIGGAIHVSELTIPEGVEVQVDASATVVHVVAPRIEEEPEPEEDELAEGEAAPTEGGDSAEPKDEAASDEKGSD